jgi:pyruvate dehydrogenase E1 component
MAYDITTDLDPIETREWLDALQAVLDNDGRERGTFILQQLLSKAHAEGVSLATTSHTPYRNTIKVEEEKLMPPDEGMGKRISAFIRWNAVAMVLRAGKYAPELGGHIASYASSSSLYEVGFNYFFKGPQGKQGNTKEKDQGSMLNQAFSSNHRNRPRILRAQSFQTALTQHLVIQIRLCE